MYPDGVRRARPAVSNLTLAGDRSLRYGEPMSNPDRDANRVLALAAGLALLSAHRRSRPLAGVLFGVFLSRAHGAGLARLEATIGRLFDERQSVIRRVEKLEARLGGGS